MGSSRATTTPRRNQQQRQCLALCVGLAAAASTTTTTTAFTSPHAATSTSPFSFQRQLRVRIKDKSCGSSQHLPRQQQQTQLYVGGKWQMPFLGSADDRVEDDDHDKSAGSAIQTNTPAPFFSSFFQQDSAEEATEKMGNLVDFMRTTTDNDDNDSSATGPLMVEATDELGDAADAATNNTLLPLFGAMAVALAVAGASAAGIVPADITANVESFFQDPTSSLEQVTETVASMGPLGPVYFGLLYTIAEVLAIPAVPLTASAGYLFGVTEGTLVVLVSASIAASISFFIGRTLLRTTVEQAMTNYPQFAKMDKAIGREGFKLMLLLRLSPLFPFALSNYLYGATSIDFASFFWGTLLGFAPGTLAYVYTGVVGKALTIGGDGAQPWYVYAGGAALLGGLLKVLVDVAGNIVQEIEDEEEADF